MIEPFPDIQKLKEDKLYEYREFAMKEIGEWEKFKILVEDELKRRASKK